MSNYSNKGVMGFTKVSNWAKYRIRRYRIKQTGLYINKGATREGG